LTRADATSEHTSERYQTLFAALDDCFPSTLTIVVDLERSADDQPNPALLLEHGCARRLRLDVGLAVDRQAPLEHQALDLDDVELLLQCVRAKSSLRALVQEQRHPLEHEPLGPECERGLVTQRRLLLVVLVDAGG